MISNVGTPHTPAPCIAPRAANRCLARRLNLLCSGYSWLGRLLLRIWISKIEIQGREHLDGDEPQLVLMNHATSLDPAILTFFGRKNLHFFVTEPFMAQDRILAKVLAWLGQVPKRKLDPDVRAIRTLKHWAQSGASIALFPEGQFSWEGEPLPLQPGIAGLVRYLDIPVVTVRLINGDRLWPAWAKVPRKTALRIEIDPPRKFKNEENIETAIAQSIRVDPATCPRWPARGKNLAHGLAQFLEFCFECHFRGGLREQGDFLNCGNCRQQWTVTPDGELLNSKKISISNAWIQNKTYLTALLQKSKNFVGRTEVTVFDSSRLQWKVAGKGMISFRENHLHIGDWKIPLEQIVAHTLDWGNILLIRSQHHRFAVQMPNESRAVWSHILHQSIGANRP